MSYGPLVLATANLITDADMFTPSSQATGSNSGARKDGTGVATINITGTYSGQNNITVEIEIDDVAAGKEIGQATFKWRTSENAAGVWQETGKLTVTTPAYALGSTGLSVGWTGRTRNDFELADHWQLFANANYGPANLLDRNRMTTWRTTGDTTENLVIDLGSAQTPTLIIIHDHNLTSGATCKIQGNAADSWGSPSVDQSLTVTDDPIYAYLSVSAYRYWRVLITDASNPDTYIEFANLFLGTYTTLNHTNADWGSRQQDGYMLQTNNSQSGVYRRYAYASQKVLDLSFGNTVSNTDVTTLQTFQTSLIDSDTKRVLPFWVHLFNDESDTLHLVDWENIGAFSHEFFAYLLNSGISMSLPEVVKI